MIISFALVTIGLGIMQFIYFMILYSIYMALHKWVFYVYFGLLGINTLTCFIAMITETRGKVIGGFCAIIVMYVISFLWLYYDSK